MLKLKAIVWYHIYDIWVGLRELMQLFRYFSIIGTYILKAMKNRKGDPWKSKKFLLYRKFFVTRDAKHVWRGVWTLIKPPQFFL